MISPRVLGVLAPGIMEVLTLPLAETLVTATLAGDDEEEIDEEEEEIEDFVEEDDEDVVDDEVDFDFNVVVDLD